MDNLRRVLGKLPDEAKQLTTNITDYIGCLYIPIYVNGVPVYTSNYDYVFQVYNTVYGTGAKAINTIHVQTIYETQTTSAKTLRVYYYCMSSLPNEVYRASNIMISFGGAGVCDCNSNNPSSTILTNTTGDSVTYLEIPVNLCLSSTSSNTGYASYNTKAQCKYVGHSIYSCTASNYSLKTNDLNIYYIPYNP